VTKLRAALTYELALTKVAGLIGWPRCAEVLAVAERTVRNWSDPDAAANIRMDAAEALDIAWQQAGGTGAPFLEVYATRLKAALVDCLGSAEAIADAAAAAAKEGGEAVSWAIRASRPNATEADYIAAEREIEEAIEANTGALAAIRNRRRAERGLLEETLN
jgi:hypothetical protein